MMLKVWIRSLLLGTGKIPCDLPKIELDLDAGEELILETRDRNGQVGQRIKVDVRGAMEAERKRVEERIKFVDEGAKKAGDRR